MQEVCCLVLSFGCFTCLTSVRGCRGSCTAVAFGALGERAYLDVPFAEKDEAKQCGARWDMAERRWYAPPGQAPGLSRWAPAAPLPAVLPGEDRACGSGLFVDLIPASCWFTNVRSCVSARDWDRLRTLVYGRAGNRCEACGAGVNREHQVWLEAHERWDYHNATRTQRLRRLVCLCTRCHQATHFGYAEVTGRAEEALAQLCAVNHWTRADTEAHVAAAASLWRFRSATLDVGTAPVRGLARLGSDSLLAALLALLRDTDPEPDAAAEPPDAADGRLPPGEIITRGLLDGHGRYTRLDVAERTGIPTEEARRLWRALGFPEVPDDQRVFTSADIAALTDAAALVTEGLLDADGVVELARPLGHQLSRLAAAQTSFISEVLGARITQGQAAEDPHLPDRLAAQAVQITHELLPRLERTTMYVWRRHLAAEAGRTLLPTLPGLHGHVDNRTAAVGFIDISGYTRLSRTMDLTELAALLERFETLVLNTVVIHGGRVIKDLGDEVLFVTDDPVSGGGGDVFGPVVNIAARIAGPRPPGQHPGR